jgi:hypothetical protein
MKRVQDNVTREIEFAKSLCGDLSESTLHALEELVHRHKISVAHGDVKYLEGGWYVTHPGLLRLAQRRGCAGIHSRPVLEASDPTSSRWIFKAAVFKSRSCRDFLAMAMPIPPMSLLWSTAPKCA